jgi:predicted anti-sigma-YlaC factor YlaD
MKCEDIQSALFDYLTRELGPARSDLVREHLRKCEKCQAAAAEIRATMDWLKLVSTQEPPIPVRLSEARRARIARALTHPVLDWIYTHHIVVSVVAAILAIVAGAILLYKTQLWDEPDEERGIDVRILKLYFDHAETNRNAGGNTEEGSP